MHKYRATTFCLVATLAFFAGCGDGRPETVQVSGRVTFGGDAPPAPGILYITAEQAAEGFPLRPATARFDQEGYFDVSTWNAADGVMPGKYRVAVECWKVPPTIGGPPAESYVPVKYQSPKTSGVTLEVGLGDASRDLLVEIP